MDLVITNEGPRLHARLDGRLDVAGVNAISDRFAFQVAGHDGPAIVDCSGVTFIASLGMGMLVGAGKALRRKGHSLTLLRPQPQVEEVLRTAGIHHVLEIVHDAGSGHGG